MGLSLRTKLFIGFGGLLAILLAVGSIGLTAITRYQTATKTTFKENYDSMLACRKMSAARESMEEFVGAAGTSSDSDVRIRLDRDIVQFEAALSIQESNIGAGKERLLTERLRSLWTPYREACRALAGGNLPAAERMKIQRDTISVPSQILRNTINSISELNLHDLVEGEENAQAEVDRVQIVTASVILIGMLLGCLFLGVVGRSILRPIRNLTSSIHQIEEDSFDLVAPIPSRDELGKLAEAFNAMASRLREYRRSDRARLIRTQQTTQLAIDSLRDAVVILDMDRRVEVSNRTARKVFNLNPGDSLDQLDKTWLTNLYNRISTEVTALYPKGFDSAIHVFDENVERYFLPNAVPILDEEKRLVGVTVVLADVTILHQLDEMKNGRISLVSHELKTPLTSLRMAVYMMFDKKIGPLNDGQKDLLEAAREDSERLFATINSLLDLSRLHAAPLSMEKGVVSMQGLVAETIRSMRHAFDEAGMTLETYVPSDLPPVNVDPRLMSIVLMNLLSNALKYSSRGDRVWVEASQDDSGRVRLSVHDTGKTIPPEYNERIFDEFFRIPDEDKTEGSGLGLAIAREIVEAHGGGISCRSGEGRGAAFHITLPAFKEDLAATDN